MINKPLAVFGTVLLCGIGFTLGCGSAPPFPSSDPPPTFAFQYVLVATTNILMPNFTGSTLEADYRLDIVGTPYVPLGNTRQFGPTYVSFQSWTTVNDGRWPAVWRFTSGGGCGAGTYGDYDVEQKLIQVSCHPPLWDPPVSPTSYNSQRVTYLTVDFSATPIPAGTVATYRFVDDGTGSIEEQYQITFNGGSSVVVEGPNDVPDGEHYLTFDFLDNGSSPDGYDAMYATVTTTGYNCIPRPGHSCL